MAPERGPAAWTTPASVRAQLLREWERGRFLAALVSGEDIFPLRLPLKGPDSRALAEAFGAVRDWIAGLQAAAGTAARPGYRVVMRDIRHRVIGNNAVPAEIWLDTLDDALAAIGKRADAERFRALLAHTRAAQPLLLPWLARRPLRALELAAEWDRLLAIVGWLQAHPRPGIYLRQIDLPGIDSKFIERHGGVLAELFELALPPAAIAAEHRGQAGFARRYGFRDKPALVRLRILDAARAPIASGIDHDYALTAEDFARLDPDIGRVFITENEINFLALPPLADSLVIFGAGYGFDMLARAAWLQTRALYYWGDLDTHGFAILDQLRAHFTHAQSLLMDRDTLFAHREHWGREPQPVHHALPRLDPDEARLYDDLRTDRLGRAVRLEQEKIGFGWVQDALRRLPAVPRM
jgi:hypothetical protein